MEFADRAFDERLSGIEGALQHAFAMGGHKQIRMHATDHLQRLAQQSACNRKFIVAQSEIEARGQHHRWMIADADRNIERLAARVGGPGQDRQMMIGRNADEGPVAA